MLIIIHVFVKLITISIDLIVASIHSHYAQCLDANPHMRHVPLPRYIVLSGWRLLPQHLFIDVAWTTCLSRRVGALASGICDLVTIATLLNELDSMFANQFKCMMFSTFLSHSWLWGFGIFWGRDKTLKVKSLHRFECPTKHGKNSSWDKNYQHIFLAIDFELEDLII